ncbi:MAG: RNA polymerase factor sigma-54, partial [Burkholderiales bacterium]|nr:RNA polymerase factor sigma-54 [Burkholderiales bacterium]
MKQGLSLRVSQHLALTPQLQQSIRLLQLSTLELSQEIEQMLDDNPFLEKEMEDLAAREDFGLAQENAVAAPTESEPDNDSWDGPMDRVSEVRVETASEASDAPLDATGVAESWDGDGSVEFSPDDSEWGGDAPARNNNNNDDEKAQATELARNQESLTAFLHRQALSLRLDDTDRAALRFLIESLNDDGYLEDSFQTLAESLAGDDLEQCEELVHRFQVALGLLQSLEPTGVGARDLGECLRLQLQAIPADTEE